MARTFILLAAAAAGAVPAVAAADGGYSVRNATARAYTCGLRREDRSVIDRFVLKAGEEWRQGAASGGERELLCDSWVVTARWRVRSGVRYQLVEEPRTGQVILLAR